MGRVLKIDGLDGSGKSTAVRRVAAALQETGHTVAMASEYGASKSVGSPLSSKIRRFVNRHELAWDDIEYEVLMTLVSRRFNLSELPVLACEHEFVVVDRSEFANYAYGLPVAAEFGCLYELLVPEVQLPCSHFWIDTPVAECIARTRRRERLSRNERRGVEYFEEVRDYYETLSLQGKMIRVDGTRSRTSVAGRILDFVREGNLVDSDPDGQIPCPSDNGD